MQTGKNLTIDAPGALIATSNGTKSAPIYPQSPSVISDTLTAHTAQKVGSVDGATTGVVGSINGNYIVLNFNITANGGDAIDAIVRQISLILKISNHE